MSRPASTLAGASAEATLSGEGRRRRLDGGAYLYLLPATLVLLAVFAVPIVQTVRLSLEDNEGISAEGTWVGGENFVDLFASGLFWRIFLQTVVWTVAVVALTTVVAYCVALVLQQRFRGRGLFRAILLLPWATSIALSAVAWKFALTPDGLVNRTLELLGISDTGVAWLADIPEAAFAVIFVGVWVSVPFTAVMLSAGMRAVPKEVYEAASLDGTGELGKNFLITIPLIRRILLIVTLANFVLVFNSFPIIWIMTEGGPVNRTDILATYLYRQGFTLLDFGLASAIAVVVLALLLALSTVYVHLLIHRTRVG